MEVTKNVDVLISNHYSSIDFMLIFVINCVNKKGYDFIIQRIIVCSYCRIIEQ